MAHIWMSHVAHLNESCHTASTEIALEQGDESQNTCLNVTHVNESSFTNKTVETRTLMSHVCIRISHLLQCNALQLTCPRGMAPLSDESAALCNTLQHNATHCNTLQHTAIRRNTLPHTATHCNTLQHTATHCNTLQLTTTHCQTTHCTALHIWTSHVCVGRQVQCVAKKSQLPCVAKKSHL